MRKFKKTYIEITNICNLSCEFCPKTERKAEFMSRELFERIVSQIKDYTKYIYFHVKGEPFLHPDIGAFLDLCKRYGCRVNITTNGILIDKVGDTLLTKPALRQVNFSLHSFESNASKHSIDDYLDKIFRFIAQSKTLKTGLQISLRLWNLSETGSNESNRYILERIEKEFALPYKIREELTPCNGMKVAENVFLNQASTFKWPDTADSGIEGRGFCYGLRDQVAILVDGTVVPCCLDGEGVIGLGNIKEQDFAEIIESSRAKNIYEGFSRREVVEDLCRKCSYRIRFNQKN
ncbi:MAG: radical SAM protein [Clostridia bacterium]|nr:radical SAM protein [Clostridia bacterium]